MVGQTRGPYLIAGISATPIEEGRWLIEINFRPRPAPVVIENSVLQLSGSEVDEALYCDMTRSLIEVKG